MKPSLFPLLASISIFFACSKTDNDATSKFTNVNVQQVVSQLKNANKLAGKNEQVVVSLKSETVLKLSDVVDSIWSLRLETTPSSLFGGIDKVRFEGNDIFILDRAKSKTLKRFNAEGKFITTIGKGGTGPGEYYEPTDFFVKGNEVIVYDQFKKVLNFYTIDGTFIKERQVPFILTSFHLFEGGKFAFHAFNADNYHVDDILGYNVLWGDSSFSLSHRAAYRKKNKYNNYRAGNNMDCFNNTLFYHEPFNDTIFRVADDGKIYYDYILSFGNKKVPEELLLEENFSKLLREMANTDYNIFIGDEVVTTDHLYLPVAIKNKISHVLYSNKSKRLISGDNVWNDINMIYNFAKIVNCRGNTLVGNMSAMELVENRERALSNGLQLDKKVFEYTKEVKDTDNSILVFFKLRDTF